jgi:hypothetical protein
MGDVKNISVDNYLPSCTDLTSIDLERDQVINVLFSREMNESNYNNKEYALTKLKGYRYASKEYIIPSGRYIRWITTTDVSNMPVRCGGFVIDDDSLIITTQSRGRFVKLSKKKSIIFVKLTREEMFKATLLNEI